MKLGLKKYLVFSKSGIQTALAYRGFIVLWLLGGIINCILMGLLWWAIYANVDSSTVGGLTFPQMLMYVLLSAAVGESVYVSSLQEISEDVHHGLIGMRLMKPISYHAQLTFGSIGSFIARFAVICAPVIALGTVIIVFGFGLTGLVWYNILLFIPACFVSMLLNDAIAFMFGQLAFRTHAMFGVSSISEVIIGFLSGAAVPLTLFPAWAQNILFYTPFPSMISSPVRIYMGIMSGADIAISFGIAAAWIIALNVIGELMYRRSVKRLVVFGG